MAWIVTVLLLVAGCHLVASELTHGCILKDNYITSHFWCPDNHRIFILESYRGCNQGNLTPRCENRTAEHHICRENRELLTDVFRKGCNNNQLCNFNIYLPRVRFEGNLRFYVWFTCTPISLTVQTLEPSDSAGSANGDQIIVQSSYYPRDFEEAKSYTFYLDVPAGVTSVSFEVKELLEENNGENVCIVIKNAQFTKNICSSTAGSYPTLFLPTQGNTIELGSTSNGPTRIRYCVILTALDQNTQPVLIPMKLSYTMTNPNYYPVSPPNNYPNNPNNNYPTPPPNPTPDNLDNRPPVGTPAPYPAVHRDPPGPPADPQSTQPTTTKSADAKQVSSVKGEQNLPIILGGVAGGILVLLALIILAVCLVARKRKAESAKVDASNPKGTVVEYYASNESVQQQGNDNKALSGCEYYQTNDLGQQVHHGKDHGCYYEASPSNTVTRPMNENHYTDIHPTTGNQTHANLHRKVVNGAVYALPNRDEINARRQGPVVPQGGVRVF